MPVLELSDLRIDYTDESAGDPVILVHSSASGNRMWKKLAELLKPKFRVLAINLWGYGETSAWAGPDMQTLADQARLVEALAALTSGPLRLVGHSFGGTVAMKAAVHLGARVSHLALLEPNPFYLLAQHNRPAGYGEALALRNHVKQYGTVGNWHRVAERFVDYFQGDGTWAATEPKRREVLAQALVPNMHEWDAVMNETAPLSAWAGIPCRTLVVTCATTNTPIVEIRELLEQAAPHWKYATVEAGGHMCPVTRPDLVNPLVDKFLAS